MVYQHPDAVDFTLADLPAMPRAGRLLMTTPDHFEVAYVINPHMEGNLGTVDAARARAQWQALRSAYEHLGVDVQAVPGAPALPDMVFCANQTLPFLLPDGGRGVLLSQMHAPQRQGEVAHYRAFFERLGYRVDDLPETVARGFEGMGDALWHPGRRLLWGGYGFRTGLGAYAAISKMLDTPVVALELDDPDFYHLDTCLSLLDETTALFAPAAFQPEGLALLRRLIPNLVEAPESEARSLFACNAHCPDGQHVLIQRGCTLTGERLRAAGFTPVEVDTDEFLKAGGSVFCMKLAYW